MATGETKKNYRDNAKKYSSKDLEYSINYAGKAEEKDILLKTEKSLISNVWSGKHSEIEELGALYLGENLSTLASLVKQDRYRGKVKLIYIDPPFATNKFFVSRDRKDAYSDLLVGSHYIEFIRERLIFLKQLLSEDGSIYLHLDDNMAFEIKLIMDEVFGRKNFRNIIVRKKSNPKNYTRKQFGNVADYIMFYSKSDKYTWNRPYNSWLPEEADREYPYIEKESGRRYKRVPIHAPGVRNGDTGKEWKGMKPPAGKHWQYKRSTLDELDEKGEIYWSSTGNPRRKIYLDTNLGIPVQDIWLDVKDPHNQNIKITGYPTEKNPKLLERIIEASSKPGDLVLDCFAGSGTTLGVASKLKRRWVGIDNSLEALNATLTRFIHGLQPMGSFSPDPKAEQSEMFEDLEAEQLLSTVKIYASEEIKNDRYFMGQLNRLNKFGNTL
ncbi:MAG: adenine-specific DNA-methyltransferase [Patescibacteria group bacterium]|nr:adenine-specific DNA-methyltransferase [Patescibacteria group bacterium]